MGTERVLQAGKRLAAAVADARQARRYGAFRGAAGKAFSKKSAEGWFLADANRLISRR